jgi:RNA polymerase sigma factor (sigma-70 family)
VLEGATPEHWQMVEANTGLIWRRVNLMHPPEDQRDDAYQDGLFGLLRAAMLFDPDKGYRFSTYADAWITQSIVRGRVVLEGRSFRREMERGDRQWVAPLSLDAELSTETDECDAGTLLGVLLADADTEHDGVLSATVAQAAEAMLGACQDAVDVEVVASMFDGEVYGALSRISERHGMTREGVRRRRIRLQEMARAHFEVAA